MSYPSDLYFFFLMEIWNCLDSQGAVVGGKRGREREWKGEREDKGSGGRGSSVKCTLSKTNVGPNDVGSVPTDCVIKRTCCGAWPAVCICIHNRSGYI